MLQIAVFELPLEEVRANNFLAQHKPEGSISYNDNKVFIGYDDGSYPVEHQIADLRHLLLSNKNALMQQQIAEAVIIYELAELEPKWKATDTNRPDWDKYTKMIDERKNALDEIAHAKDVHKVKAAFVEAQIAALQSSNDNDSTPTATKKAKKEKAND